jgi:hypothetical protein
MKRFDFSLEQVMQWRRLRADVERAKLESLYTRLRDLDQQKLSLEAEEASAHDVVKNQDSVRSQQLLALDRFARHMSTQKELLDANRVALFGEISQQQIQLIAAQRDFELLEKLKTQKKEDWQAAFNREQEGLAGDAYLAKWERQQCS